MTGRPLADVNALYHVAGECVITAELVGCESLREFSAGVRSFDRDTKLLASEAWIPFARKASRSAWDLLNTPLPLCSPAMGLSDTAARLREMASANRLSSRKELVERARHLAAILEDLGRRNDDPLGTRCREILATGDLRRSALLVREACWLEAVDGSFRNAGVPVEVFVPTSLREGAPLETLVVSGQAQFYPDAVFSAPRAESVAIVRFSWLGDIVESAPLLPGAENAPLRIRHFALPSEQPPSAQPADEEFEPAIEWSTILSDSGPTGPAEFEPDHVDARLFALAGYFAVYLEVDEGPGLLVVDPEADREHRLGRKQTRDVEVGDFLLLRKERSEYEFLEDTANRLLGSQAASLREAQAAWKRALRARVRIRGVDGVARDLSARGCSVQNVRYWANSASIRTQRARDFEILADYLGLRDEAADLWAKMGRIVAAHRVAGFRIRKNLIELVRTADLGELATFGMVELDLPEHEAGALGVFRVESLAPEESAIARRMLRVPFAVDRELWLG